jgi:hypothetical protein
MHQNKDEYYEQAKNGDKVFFMQKQSDLQKLILVYVQSAAVEPFVILSKAYARLSLQCLLKWDKVSSGQTYLQQAIDKFTPALRYDQILSLDQKTQWLIHKYNLLYAKLKIELHEDGIFELDEGAKKRNLIDQAISIKKINGLLKYIENEKSTNNSTLSSKIESQNKEFITWFKLKFFESNEKDLLTITEEEEKIEPQEKCIEEKNNYNIFYKMFYEYLSDDNEYSTDLSEADACEMNKLIKIAEKEKLINSIENSLVYPLYRCAQLSATIARDYYCVSEDENMGKIFFDKAIAIFDVCSKSSNYTLVHSEVPYQAAQNMHKLYKFQIERFPEKLSSNKLKEKQAYLEKSLKAIAQASKLFNLNIELKKNITQKESIETQVKLAKMLLRKNEIRKEGGSSQSNDGSSFVPLTRTRPRAKSQTASPVNVGSRMQQKRSYPPVSGNLAIQPLNRLEEVTLLPKEDQI